MIALPYTRVDRARVDRARYPFDQPVERSKRFYAQPRHHPKRMLVYSA